MAYHFTIADVKRHMHLPDDAGHEVDHKIDTAIQTAQGIVEGYIGMPLEGGTFTHVVDYRFDRGPWYFLPHNAYATVTGIVTDGVPMPVGHFIPSPAATFLRLRTR
jgi:hypothetical protein